MFPLEIISRVNIPSPVFLISVKHSTALSSSLKTSVCVTSFVPDLSRKQVTIPSPSVYCFSNMREKVEAEPHMVFPAA